MTFSFPPPLFIKLTRHKIILLFLCGINLTEITDAHLWLLVTYHVYVVFMLFICLAGQQTILQ